MRSEALDAVALIPLSTLYGDDAYDQLDYQSAPRHHDGWLVGSGSPRRGMLRGGRWN